MFLLILKTYFISISLANEGKYTLKSTIYTGKFSILESIEFVFLLYHVNHYWKQQTDLKSISLQKR